MADFYATYSPSAPSGAAVVATQGTSPWVVAGNGTAGTAATGVLSVQGIASMTAIKTDGSGVTQPVKGIGVAGTADAGVLTIQGIAGGTAVPISGSITASNASIGTTGAAVPASATYIGATVAGTLTGLAATSNGLKVDGSAVTQPVTGTGTAGTAAVGVVTVQGIASMTALKVDGSAVTQPANVTQFGSNNVVTGTGAGGNGIPRVTVSSDSTLTSVGTVSTVTAVTTVSTVTAVTAITNALPAGSNTIGNTISTASSAAVWQAEGNIAAGSITSSYQTVLTPSASTKIIMMRNNTNAAVAVSMDAGTTTNFVLDSGDQVSIDHVANGLISATTAIQVKQSGVPSTGSFRVNACH